MPTTATYSGQTKTLSTLESKHCYVYPFLCAKLNACKCFGLFIDKTSNNFNVLSSSIKLGSQIFGNKPPLLILTN